MVHQPAVSAVPGPPFLYGTAWKEERTTALTELALATGFRGIDTANQRKHYAEASVGDALRSAYAAGTVRRADLFLQTKYTYVRGQDHRLPYDAAAPAATQVRQSFASSLEHLGTNYLDSYLIHGPERADRLTDNDWAVWRVMEELHDAGAIRHLGISNVSASQIQALAAGARVKVTYVQNRCYAGIAWDAEARATCRRLGIVYQGFNLLRDPLVWGSPVVAAAATRLGVTKGQVIYEWARRVGMLPLTGTTDAAHQREALASVGTPLTDAEVAAIDRLGG